MKSRLSYLILLLVKYLSKLFYSYRVGWPRETIPWHKIKLIVLLNHTSLYEFLYIGFLPDHFLRRLSKRLVAPAADKTLNRPIVGSFFKLFSPGLISITRKRDDSWSSFLESIYDDSMIFIAPEGRMKRENGLDTDGNKMTVRSGVADILAGLQNGKMIFAYSGGLHHVQIPDKGIFPKLFKTLKMNLEIFDIASYKQLFSEPVGSELWKEQIMSDMQERLENKVPV